MRSRVSWISFSFLFPFSLEVTLVHRQSENGRGELQLSLFQRTPPYFRQLFRVSCILSARALPRHAEGMERVRLRPGVSKTRPTVLVLSVGSCVHLLFSRIARNVDSGRTVSASSVRSGTRARKWYTVLRLQMSTHAVWLLQFGHSAPVSNEIRRQFIAGV